MKDPKEKVVVLSAVRTPIGRFGGAFKETNAVALAVSASVEAMKRAAVSPGEVDEVIIGQARQAGNRPNPARQVLFHSKVPVSRTAYTVNMACASGMKAIMLGCQSLLLGESKVVLAGGTENMSQIPYLLDAARWGYRLGDGALIDAMYRDGLFCPLAGMVMGETAEVLAEKYGISRREQDEFAHQSQMKAKEAGRLGKFKGEIVPVSVKGKAGRDDLVVDDEHPRPDSTLESLGALPPVFKNGGSVTAGNASGLTDGAAALVLTTQAEARRLGAKPLAEILGVTSAAVDPKEMGLGPVPAVKKIQAALKLELADLDLIEINEAFAAQVLACERELRWDPARRNTKGGAIALGHPIGCTGARITVTLLHSLIQEDKELGLATLCVSGGQGMALVLRRT
jgi:acetyl-CoA C-acetyltransferase